MNVALADDWFASESGSEMVVEQLLKALPMADLYALESVKDDFYLAASRTVPHKRLDLIVDAFAQMPERQLVVFGDGPEFKRLASKVTPNVKLLG